MTTIQSSKIYFKRDELEQAVDVAEHIIFSIDINATTAGKKFRAFNRSSSADMEIMEMLLATDNHMYEVIYPDRVIKPFFDLDYKGIDESQHKDIGAKFIECVIKYISTNFNICLEIEDFSVLDSCRQGRLSYHIVIQDKVCFNTMADHKMFSVDLITHILDTEPSFVCCAEKKLTMMDLMVYGNFQNFRCVNQSKKKSPEHILKNVCNLPVADHFITLYNGQGNRIPIITIRKDSGTPSSPCSPRITSPLPICVMDFGEDKFLDLLFNVIKNDKNTDGARNISRANWFRICGILKTNNYDISHWLRWSRLSSQTDTAYKQWNRLNSKYVMSIYGLQNIAKSVNPTGYKNWIINNIEYEAMTDDVFSIERFYSLKIEPPPQKNEEIIIPSVEIQLHLPPPVPEIFTPLPAVVDEFIPTELTENTKENIKITKQNERERIAHEKSNAREIDRTNRINARNKAELEARNNANNKMYENKIALAENKIAAAEKKKADAIKKAESKIKQENTVALNKLRTEYFELFHCKIMTPSLYIRKGTNDYDLYKKQTLQDNYSNLEEHEFINNWLQNPSMRTYEYVGYMPTPLECPDNMFNLWKGLECDSWIKHSAVDMDMIEVFLKHLWLLVGKNNKCLEYVLNYLAHIVQFPGVLPRTALVFKSVQGTGKNVFFEGFCNSILGKRYLLSTCKMDMITGRFPMINQKLMVIMDECSGKDSFLNSEIIKGQITAETLPFERKGIDAIDVLNTGRMIFLTNNGMVKIEQTDRRFNVYECSDDMANNKTYFDTLVSALKNQKKMEMFASFLKKRDLSKVDFIKDRVITSIYKEMKTATIPAEIKFIIHSFNNGWNVCDKENLTLMDGTGIDADMFKTKTFYDLYKTWCVSIKYTPNTEMAFSKKFVASICEKIRRGDGKYIQINMDKLRKFIVINSPEEDFDDDDIDEEFPSTYSNC
jgi:hypothetical protein